MEVTQWKQTTVQTNFQQLRVLVIVFWDEKIVLLAELKQTETTINVAIYCLILNRLR